MPYSYDPDAIAIVPEGVIEMTVTDVKETTSKKGDPMWIVQLEDDDGNEAAEFVVHKPNIIDWKFKPLWEAAGLKWPAGKAVIDETELINKRVMVTIKHEKSADFGLQPRIHGYEPLGTAQLDDGQGSFEPKSNGAAAVDDDTIPFD